jgi:hypothetical protein
VYAPLSSVLLNMCSCTSHESRRKSLTKLAGKWGGTTRGAAASSQWCCEYNTWPFEASQVEVPARKGGQQLASREGERRPQRDGRHREVWSSPPGGRRRGGPVETRLPLTLPQFFPTWPLGGDPAVSPQLSPGGEECLPLIGDFLPHFLR